METKKARMVGINHVALEVDSIDEAIAFYEQIFELSFRGRSSSMAFLDIGDQFIALAAGREQAPDRHRHFGLVVDDKEKARAAAEKAGAKMLGGRGVDFLDPWGNFFQIVQYDEIQFTKDAAILGAMGFELGKTDKANEELDHKFGAGWRS
jgi:predicted enzyme related to lactoylglutathione lyase